MRVFEDLLREIGAGAAGARAAGATAELRERTHARFGGFADRALGDGVADADVHGAYLNANANDCQLAIQRASMAGRFFSPMNHLYVNDGIVRGARPPPALGPKSAE